MKRGVEFVAVAKIGTDIRGPLIGLSKEHSAGIGNAQALAEFANDGVGFGQVFTRGSFALDKKGDRVQTETIDTEIQPEPHYVPEGFEDGGIVVVEVGLMTEESVPVIRLRDGIPGPVRDLAIDKNDGDTLVTSVGVAPYVPIAPGIVAGALRQLKPEVLVGGVIENEFDDDADAAGMGGVEECLEFLQRSVGWIPGSTVGDIVAIIAQRGGVERKKPNGGNAKLLQVVELLGEAGEIAHAVGIAVIEGADVKLVDNGVFVPEIVPLQRQGSTPLR